MTTQTSHPLVRLYRRDFENKDDLEEFMSAVNWIQDRISAVSMKYQAFRIEEAPLSMYEVWHYPDEQTMAWVQQAMEGAVAIPRKFKLKTMSETLRLEHEFDCDEG